MNYQKNKMKFGEQLKVVTKKKFICLSIILIDSAFRTGKND